MELPASRRFVPIMVLFVAIQNFSGHIDLGIEAIVRCCVDRCDL